MIYQNIYNVISEYIFNNAIESGSFQELATVMVSTALSLGALVLPLVLICSFLYSFIK